MDKKVTPALASEALDSLDDFASMDVGVDAMGPRKVLEAYITESSAEIEKLRSLNADYVHIIHEHQARLNKYEPTISSAASLVCPSCGVDRLKSGCSKHPCAMTGTAYAASPLPTQQESA